jgi:Beta-ketoacyl synthase, N-terminal domain
MEVFIRSVSIWGPGLEGWEVSRPILAGEQPYEPRPSPAPAPALLSPNERRRAGQVTRLALAVAQEAAARAEMKPDTMRSVFGSSNGDAIVIHDILEALASVDRPVSPTQFHNSVHNAAAGYWTIATESHQPATSLGCHDHTMAASLLKAVAEARVEQKPVLLCLYDVPVPAPLHAKRTTECSFGAAFVLVPEDDGKTEARIAVGYTAEPCRPGAEEPRQEALRPLTRGNPAAESLRILEAVARRESDRFSIPYLDGRLDITVTPC